MNPAGLLMADRSACLRWLVLRDLFGRDDSDPEMAQLRQLREEDPLVTGLLSYQQKDGSWAEEPVGALKSGGSIRMTAQALLRLGYFGFGMDHPGVRKGIEYLISRQQSDGSWPLAGREKNIDGSSGYSMISLQTSLPLRAIGMCGCMDLPEIERAYEWLLAQRLPDGAWGTGIAAGNYGGVAGYRRLAHSRWGCRSNTTGALACLSLHEEYRKSEAARKALDLILGHESRDKSCVGFETARIVGAEPSHGFLTCFARFDMAQILDICSRTGITTEDERVRDIVDSVRQMQGKYGLFEYSISQASRWVTLDILRSLSRMESTGGNGWTGTEPRTPFQAYPKRTKRY